MGDRKSRVEWNWAAGQGCQEQAGGAGCSGRREAAVKLIEKRRDRRRGWQSEGERRWKSRPCKTRNEDVDLAWRHCVAVDEAARRWRCEW